MQLPRGDFLTATVARGFHALEDETEDTQCLAFFQHRGLDTSKSRQLQFLL
jgi:hypothetical protein